MKGYITDKTKLRRRVFEEVARLAYEGGGPEQLDDLPYKIISGENEPFRDSIFLERAIIGERLRVAMGMSLRKINEHANTSKGVDESMIAEKYYEPPLIDIIRFACNCCPDGVTVTNGCQGCLEHPCKEVCPKDAITIQKDGRSVIDPDKCIKCGRCVQVCPFNAIVKQERPCEKACGINAIHKDEYGHAEIDQEKCVSCGMCLNSCPFAAIVDKGQIYQTIKAMQGDAPVIAMVAPSIAGQFGKELTDTKMKEAFGKLGFADVVEVAVGADLCTIQEAEHFMHDVPENMPFMGTSCCPAWSIMAKKQFPEFAGNISMALTPMVLSARLAKKLHPECKVAFIGPCLSKKQEASRRSVKSYVDFVLTYEEVAGMFAAKGVDFGAIPEGDELRRASSDGYGFARSGGVAEAVKKRLEEVDPDREVLIERAEGLDNCRKMLMRAKAGKLNGYLLEGMACPGGCIGGAGTLLALNRADYQLGVSEKEAGVLRCSESRYADMLPGLEHLDEEVARIDEEVRTQGDD